MKMIRQIYSRLSAAISEGKANERTHTTGLSHSINPKIESSASGKFYGLGVEKGSSNASEARVMVGWKDASCCLQQFVEGSIRIRSPYRLRRWIKEFDPNSRSEFSLKKVRQLPLSTDPLLAGDYGWFFAKPSAIKIVVSLPVTVPRGGPRIKSGLDREDLQVLPNATLLRKVLIPYVQENVFSVDINAQQLPHHNPPWEELSAPAHSYQTAISKCFYARTSIHYWEQADIREDYPCAAIVKLMGELGVGGDDAMVPLLDPRWQTVLGKAIGEDKIAEAS
ncbi:hypothetical protein EDD85DRAFT_786420 [Armillaria nabsnona]|nr:hypothetical protein EDD85DRAFT_786420 [Armillaria nabsnona]